MDEKFNFLELLKICMLLLQVNDLEIKIIRVIGEEVVFLDIKIKEDI